MNAKIAAQTVSGPIEKVPCPWCGKHNNFTHCEHLIVDAGNESMGEGDPGGGSVFECDFCTKQMRVVSVRRVVTVYVRQVQ